MTTAGETLRWLRERRGMTKYRLSEITGLCHSNIFQMEAGTRRMNAGHIAAFIEAMDLAVDEIEELIHAAKEERTADLDDLLEREYVRLFPQGIRRAS